MPVQVIDLRTFVRDRIDVGPGYNTNYIISSHLTNVTGINLNNIESTYYMPNISSHNEDGKEYVLVGYNKVGDGSVIGP